MRRLRHLTRRFFEVSRARALRPEEQAEVAAVLRDGEAALFWSQPAADQRHGLDAARHVASTPRHRMEVVRAALLHDVGKRHAGLGVVGRTFASGMALLRLPVPARFAAYLDHGAVGAAELEACGAEPEVVAYARDHHAERPALLTPEEWGLLAEADGERPGRGR